MELVTCAKELFQNAAEQVASYRVGQTILRQLDRALWVVEKCARWAVPPPLDQDERPQPELIRPLPWVFFLILLISLRITREFISLLNLVMGKPPLRSADVVMYIQGKRRYLRTLKYQGNRMMRARTSTAQPPQGWMSKIQSLFEVTMCFRRPSHYGNNNTSTNNEELLVVKRSKGTHEPSTSAAATETTMERLIEKMMIDLDADSDEDSNYTLSNMPSLRSDPTNSNDSDEETVHNTTSTTPEEASPIKTDGSPNKTENDTTLTGYNTPKSKNTSPEKKEDKNESFEEGLRLDGQSSPKTESQMFLEGEKRTPRKMQTPKSEQKIGSHVERRDADAPVTRKADMSF